MNIFNLFRKQPGTGANLDTRPQSEKEKDYHFSEIVATANPVNWVEKPQSEWRKFPIYNQNGSGSCVAQTMAKLLGIFYWLKNGNYVHFSATHIYQRRINKATGGMGGVNVFDIAKTGVTLEELAPSQSMTDDQMTNFKIDEYKVKVGEIFKIGNFVMLPVMDIDTIASVIQTTGKGVMVWVYFKNDEWTEVPTIKYPGLTADAPGVGRHSITAVDFTLYKGEKALIIDDSWGTSYGKAGQRVITESFFKERNFFAAYPLNFAFEDQTQPSPSPTPTPTPTPTPDPSRPRHTFAQKLVFIPWDTPKNQPSDIALNENQKVDVAALQDILKYEGFFPTSTMSTGYFGAITAKGLLLFQKKYTLDTVAVLDGLAGKIVGPKTITKLNELYSN